MTWAEFRRWAWFTYRYKIKGGRGRTAAAWRPVVGLRAGSYSDRHLNAATGTGSGHYAKYGLIHQRRFAVWLRMEDLVDKTVLYEWLDESERFDDGWLVNDGSGIRWLAHPEKEAHQLVERGFVAVKCGL